MKKCLVTGSNGFIGTHLVKALKDKGVQVVEFNQEKKIDVIDKTSFKDLEGVEVVFHLAAVSGYKNSNTSTNLTYKANALGVVNVLDYCKKVGAKMIFPSTYVYDKPYGEVKVETDKTNPSTHYSFTKYLGEGLCSFYSRVFKVQTTILRTSNVYGPGQNDIYLVPIIREHLLEDKPLELTRPDVERSFIYIDDLVEAYIKIAEAETKAGEIFNVGPDESTSLKKLVGLMERAFGKTLKITYSGKDRPSEVDVNRVSNKKIMSVIDWKPEIGLKEGLKKLKRSSILK